MCIRDRYNGGEGNIGAPRYREWCAGLAESKTQSMHANSLHGNRDIPGTTDCNPQSARSKKVYDRNLDMHVNGKSDEGIVSMKRANNGTQPVYRPTTGGCLLYTSPSPRDGLLSR